MANHKSALKRNRQNKKKCERNKGFRTQMKTTTKRVLAEVENNDQENAQKELKIASRTIARIASKGVIHRRTAARKISGLAKKVHQLSATG